MVRVTAGMVAAGRTIGEPRVSPDGETVAFVVTDAGGTWIATVPCRGGAERRVTTDPSPRPARWDGGGVFDWMPDGGAVVYAATDGGLWLQAVEGGPPRRLVAPHPDGRAESPVVSRGGARVAFTVGQRHVAIADTRGGGWPVLAWTTETGFVLDPQWLADGRVVVHTWEPPAMPWEASRLLAIRAPHGETEVLAEGGALAQPGVSVSGRLAWLDDASGRQLVTTAGSGPPAPYVPDAAEHGRPAWGPGIRTWAWSPAGDDVAVNRNQDGFGSLRLLRGARDLGKGWHTGLSWAGDRLVALRSGARTPTQLVSYATETGERTVLAHAGLPGWGDAALPEPEVVRVGDVVARVYAPPGASSPPALLWVHGGPTDQRIVAFNPRLAYWLDRGWAIVDVDHRGSTGHGRAWQRALDGQWGVADVEDCAAVVAGLAGSGRIDPARIVAMGASAGGFTALNLLASHPEVFAAGVAGSAVAGLADLTASSHRFERHYNHSLVGPLPASAEEYRKRSPLARAGGVRAPVLLLHGDADEVVPVAQARSLEARLRAAGVDVELHEYAGEGHGWSSPSTVRDELERTERFLARHVPSGDPSWG